MENFIAFNPTKVHFGKDVTNEIGQTVLEFGKQVLLVYGKGSVVKNGIYDKVKSQLLNAGINIIEYSGIKSNPIIDDVDAAAKLGIDKKVDAVVAIGGGSVIDSAKIIAICIAEKCKGWDVMKHIVIPSKSTPLIAVLTLAATGTEMNNIAVVQNHNTNEKIGYSHEVMFPKHSFLDPSFTTSVPKSYTSYGVIDLIAHCFEAWFGKGDASLSDRFVEAIIKEAMEFGPRLIDNLDDYDLRARIMWAATNALNGLTSYGRAHGEWGVHALGHVLSLMYDVPHGASLSIVYPAWLRLHADRTPDRISKLGQYLFNETDVNKTIDLIEDLFRKLGGPVRLAEYGIKENKHAEIIDVWQQNKSMGQHHKLSPDDYRTLIQLMK